MFITDLPAVVYFCPMGRWTGLTPSDTPAVPQCKYGIICSGTPVGLCINVGPLIPVPCSSVGEVMTLCEGPGIMLLCAAGGAACMNPAAQLGMEVP